MSPDRKTPRLWWIAPAGAVAKRPDLWGVAAFEVWVLAGRGWWKRWPFVPLPAKPWFEFRMDTAYGDKRARPSAADTLAWLEWCRTERRRERSLPRPAVPERGP